MASSLAIGRFGITAEIASSPEARTRAQGVVDCLDERRLVEAVTRRLNGQFADDDRVLVLDRLNIDLVGVALDEPDRIGGMLADAVAHAIGRAACGRPLGASVTHGSLALRLAGMVLAMARGEAWDKWWYADIDHLKILSRSVAIRTALSRDTICGLQALAASTAADRATILRQLSKIDLDLFVSGLVASLPDAGANDVWAAVFDLPPASEGLSPDHQALFWLAELACSTDGLPDRHALGVIRFRIALAGRDQNHIAMAIMAREARALRELVPEARVRDIAQLLALPHSQRELIVASLATEHAAVQDSTHGYTEFGGLLLLWPFWPESGEDREPDEARGGAHLGAFLGLAGLWPVRDVDRIVADPVLRQVFGLDARISLPAMVDWLASQNVALLPTPTRSKRRSAAVPDAFRTVSKPFSALTGNGLAALSEFARRLPGFGDASLEFLRDNLLSIGAQVTFAGPDVCAVLERPNLDVLLGISGLANRSHDLGDGRTLHLERGR